MKAYKYESVPDFTAPCINKGKWGGGGGRRNKWEDKNIVQGLF
jgi:hypothetical protein